MEAINPVCPGTNCPLKDDCKRYKEHINYKTDVHFAWPPYNHELKKCGYFIGDKSKGILSHLKKIINGDKSQD